MTTTTARRNIQDTTAERNGTNDARQAGAVERGELPELRAAALERMADLAMAGRLAESRAMHRREFETKNQE